MFSHVIGTCQSWTAYTIIFSINCFLDQFLGKCYFFGNFNVALVAEKKERAVRNSLLQSMLR